MIPAKRVLLFVYDSFAEFEVAVLVTALRGTSHSLTTVGLTGAPVRSTGLLTVLPDTSLAEVDPRDHDALVVPGGQASGLLGHPQLRDLVSTFAASGRLVAAICGGPAVLGDAGALDGRRFTASLTPADAAWPGVEGRGQMVPEHLVTDGNVVTATGSSYVAFAAEVLRVLDGAADSPDLSYFSEPSLA